jgi:hypothetical protein
MSGYLAIGFRSNKVGDKADVTHPQPLPATAALALKSLADFWADMGLEEARALNIPRAAAQRPAAGTRPATPARQHGKAAFQPPVTGARPEPRRINNNPIADARKLAASANSMAELRAIIDQFDGCPLKKAAKNTVVCDGAYDADVMIVGEAPGGEEDAQGLPFVGRAGKLLDKMLATDRPVAAGECLHHQPDLLASAGQPRSLARRDADLRPIPVASDRTQEAEAVADRRQVRDAGHAGH